MSEIRVRYSGFIIFAAQILSVFTGLIFLLLITRNSNGAEDLGAWSFIFYLVGLFTFISGLFPFWATRFVARGKEDAVKTAVLANLLLAVAATAIYLPSVSFVLQAFRISDVYLVVYLIAGLQIVNTYLVAVFEACLRAVKPQAMGYGLLIEEVVKVSLAYAIFIGLKQLFLGGIAGIVVGASVQAVFYVWLLKDFLRKGINWGYLREWLKGGSAAFIYNAAGVQLTGFVLYFLVLFGGQAALGNYQVAVIFSTVIGYASSLAFALYPKMLAQDCPEDATATFSYMMMLALPMAAVTLTMSTSLLTIMSTSYGVASPVLILLTFDALIVLVSGFYTNLLLGTETLDVAGKIPLRQLVRSKIFKVFTLPYIQAAVALPTVFYVLTQAGFADAVQATIYVVTVNIVVHAVTFSGLYVVMRKEFAFSVPWKSLGKYLGAALVAATLLVVLPSTSTLTMTFGKMLLGFAAYAAILLATDANARKLVVQIKEEIRSILH